MNKVTTKHISKLASSIEGAEAAIRHMEFLRGGPVRPLHCGRPRLVWSNSRDHLE